MTHALAPTDGTVAPTALDPRLPAPINKRTLGQYLTLIEDPDTLKLQNRLAGAYDAACGALLGPNDIQMESGRSFKKKSAWRKLARYFGISTSVIDHSERYLVDETTGESTFVASCTVRGTAPWGQTTDATGACGTDEESGRRKISIADAIATAQTRADNRAVSNLVAMGEVSAEEATREERTQGTAAAVAADMTLDEARAVPFPWRTPEKYRGKSMGELSLRMLDAVLSAVEKEIETGGPSTRRTVLLRSAQLLKAEKEKEKEAAKAKAAAEPEPASEPAKAPATLDELHAAVKKLLVHPALPAPARVSYRAWYGNTSDEAGLRELIHSLESSIEDAADTNRAKLADEEAIEDAKLQQRDDGDDDRDYHRSPMAGDVDDNG